jgi:hypothetical protein
LSDALRARTRGVGIDDAVATLANEFVANLKLTSPLPRKFLRDAFDVAAKIGIFAFQEFR